MTETLKPENAEQVLDAVQWAAAEKAPLKVVGRGSKDGFGRPVVAPHTLDMSGLSGIRTYEPNELFMTTGAATPIAEIEAALRQNNQQMAFEPSDLGALLGGAEEAGSIGGAIACNLGGPRRISAGAARDHFLGFNAVSGRGEVFKSGGTVVKNVTGFDLSKLIAGSFGTLAVMTDVTFKVLPAPEKTRTVLAIGLSAADAMKAMSVALGSSNEISAAAHLPDAAAAASAVDYVSGNGGTVTAVRLEGPGPSVEHRCRAVRALWEEFGCELEELHSENSRTLWREVRDVGLLKGDGPYDGPGHQVWRLSVPPMSGAVVAENLAADLATQVLYDWGGGLVWLAVDAGPDAGAEQIRRAVAEVGGHATLIRAAEDVRGRVAVFEPQTGALKGLTERVKEGFDPHGILNPGRMVEGV
ncbi:MAG: glycolate oxidase subunit GlcE [Rhodospirillales bacterium]|nr:glycolate oxidase subunit GlcE [Rhodospirillales bacterium]